jgi:hypothetical protein
MRRRRLFHVLAAVTLALAGSIALLEAFVRVWQPALPFTEPANDVLFLDPDPRVGWRHPKNFTFYWNGRNPYCIEFRVQVATNDFGFRDRARTLEKPPGTLRVAVLGDSFIEAIQVPLEETATALLEARLGERLAPQRVEVLNFGVSNYGVGQYLLLYDAAVRAFEPDYVVAFASYLNFSRTEQRELSSRLQDFYALSVRPSFQLESTGALVPLPAADYAEYAERVQRLIATEFGDDRSVAVPPIPTPLALPHWMLNVVSRKARPSASPHGSNPADFPHVELNYRILQELNAKVRSDGAELVFADAFEYLERYGVVRGSGALVPRNRELFATLGAGYVDLSPALRASGANPQFECDMHFNAVGHRLIADTLADWFAATIDARPDRPPMASSIMDSTAR